MKTKVTKYKVTILTSAGPVTVEYCDNQPIAEFEAEMLARYGSFVTLHSRINKVITTH